VEPRGLAERATLVDAGGDDALWVAGLTRAVRHHQGRWEPVSGTTPDQISTLRAARSGEAWVGTRSGGVFHASPGEGGWQAALEDWAGEYVRSMAEDRRGRIWVGGSDGHVAFGGEEGPWEEWGPETGLRANGVVSLLADREGGVWFGLNGEGLQHWVGEGWSHRAAWEGEDPHTSRVHVFGINGTHAGGFLAASFRQGLWHWDGSRMHSYGRDQGLTEDVRYPIEPEPGVIWAGSRFGLFESRNGGRFRQVLSLETPGFVSHIERSRSLPL
jgi:hypothetical protein